MDFERGSVAVRAEKCYNRVRKIPLYRREGAGCSRERAVARSPQGWQWEYMRKERGKDDTWSIGSGRN